MENRNDYIQGWLRHRTVLEQFLELIDDEHMHYKPWEGAFTLGNLAVHIAGATDMFVQSVKNGQFVPSSVPAEFAKMDDVRRTVREATAKTTADLETITDAQLERTIEIFQFVAPGKIWLSNAKDHEIHHKGQLFTYARLLGIENLPFFVVQPPKL